MQWLDKADADGVDGALVEPAAGRSEHAAGRSETGDPVR
jgi:hypothetical protein